MSQLDLFGVPQQRKPLSKPARASAARVLRDHGMAEAMEHERDEWRDLYRYEMRAFLKDRGDRAFLSEEFRKWFRSRGNREPHHPNVWGAMWNACATEGWIEKTGKHRPTTYAAGHATDGTEWKKGLR